MENGNFRHILFNGIFSLFLIWMPSWEGEVMIGQFAWMVKIKVLIINSFICFEMLFCDFKNVIVRHGVFIHSFFLLSNLCFHTRFPRRHLKSRQPSKSVPWSSVNFCFLWNLDSVYSILHRFCFEAALLFSFISISHLGTVCQSCLQHWILCFYLFSKASGLQNVLKTLAKILPVPNIGLSSVLGKGIALWSWSSKDKMQYLRHAHLYDIHHTLCGYIHWYFCCGLVDL